MAAQWPRNVCGVALVDGLDIDRERQMDSSRHTVSKGGHTTDHLSLYVRGGRYSQPTYRRPIAASFYHYFDHSSPPPCARVTGLSIHPLLLTELGLWSEQQVQSDTVGQSSTGWWHLARPASNPVSLGGPSAAAHDHQLQPGW